MNVADFLDSVPLEKQKNICRSIGEIIGKLHKLHIIHGDLTTSNMIIKENQIIFIDFGLGYVSQKIEDKAVDLHLLKQAFEARHYKNWKILINEIFNSYKKIIGEIEAKKIFDRIEMIEKRGRYRH